MSHRSTTNNHVETEVTRPPKLRQSSQRKRDTLMEKATELFLEKGFEGVSMDALAEQAQISKRTLYAHFANKQALFAAVVERMCATVMPKPKAADQPGDLREGMEQLAVVFLRSIYTPEQLELYRTVLTDARRFPELGALMMNGPIKRSESMIKEFILSRAAIGELTVDDADLMAAQFLGMLKTDLHMRLLFRTCEAVPLAELRRIAKATVTLFIDGAAPRLPTATKAAAKRAAGR